MSVCAQMQREPAFRACRASGLVTVGSPFEAERVPHDRDAREYKSLTPRNETEFNAGVLGKGQLGSGWPFETLVGLGSLVARVRMGGRESKLHQVGAPFWRHAALLVRKLYALGTLAHLQN